MTFLRRGPWKARSPWKGRGPWCAKGPFGVNDIAWTLDATAAAIREAIGNADAWGTTGATTGWRLPGLGSVRLSADAMTGPRLEQQQDGTYRWAAHNLLLNSATLSTQSVTVVVGEQYTIAATGTGSVALSGAATGTLNASALRPSLTVTATTTTLTCTVTGTVTAAQVNRGATALAYVPTAGAARYAPAVTWDAALGVWGLRSEPAATNLVLWSADMGNAAWTALAGEISTAPVSSGPFLAATRLTENTATAQHYLRQDLVTANALHTFSIFAKRDSGTRNLVLYPQGGVIGWTIFNLETGAVSVSGGGAFSAARIAAVPGHAGWYRCELVWTPNATTTAMVMYMTNDTVTPAPAYAGDGTSSILLAMPQLETGSRATSPIPTFAATVTRTIDDVRWPDFMDAEGVVVVEWVPLVAGDSSSPVLFGTSASINHGPFTDGTQALSHWNGSAVLTATGAIAVGARNAAVLSWSASGRAVALNGGAVATDAGAIGTTDLFRIGATGAGNQPYPLLMTRIRTAPRRPPNDRVRTLGIVS
jgi:hypothetical protein